MESIESKPSPDSSNHLLLDGNNNNTHQPIKNYSSTKSTSNSTLHNSIQTGDVNINILQQNDNNNSNTDSSSDAAVQPIDEESALEIDNKSKAQMLSSAHRSSLSINDKINILPRYTYLEHLNVQIFIIIMSVTNHSDTDTHTSDLLHHRSLKKIEMNGVFFILMYFDFMI